MKNLLNILNTLKSEKTSFKSQLKKAKSKEEKLELRYMIAYTDLCIFDLENSISKR